MSPVAIARSSLGTSLARYSRSWGIWILLLIGPVGAKFLIPRHDSTTVVIAVAGQLPVMTSAVVGVCLGLVVSTLMLPAAYVYLRTNTNRRQPWQVEEVTPAPRASIALGRFAADATVLLGALTALNLAGTFLAWLLLPAGTLNLLELTLALWVIAAPPLLMVAALRVLFDALPLLRGSLGDVAFFLMWTATLPSLETHNEVGFLVNMADPIGFVRPLIFGSGLEDPGFTIGGGPVEPGVIPIDAMAGIMSGGYLPSRAAWAAIALLVAVAAGLAYRPHRLKGRPALWARLGKLAAPRTPPAADIRAAAARPAALPLVGLIRSELLLIASGRVMQTLAVVVAAAGLLGSSRATALSLALLWSVFALSARAGSNENRGARRLVSTLPTPAYVRRFAFVVAGTTWFSLLAMPYVLLNADAASLVFALGLGALVSVMACVLAAVGGSGFAPRMVLLIAWYIYVAS